MSIRKAEKRDLSRIAEIFVFNNRINYYPIFGDAQYSFGDLQVLSVIDDCFGRAEVFANLYVFDDGIVKGFTQMNGTEIVKLYADPFFQGHGVGRALIEFAVAHFGADHLWALEKNTRAIAFYGRHGFLPTGGRKFEEGTTESLIELERKAED